MNGPVCNPSNTSWVYITVSNSPNPPRVWMRLCKHGKIALLLKANTITVVKDGQFMHVLPRSVFSSLNNWPYKIRKDEKKYYFISSMYGIRQMPAA